MKETKTDRPHFIISSIEHDSVLKPLKELHINNLIGKLMIIYYYITID